MKKLLIILMLFNGVVFAKPSVVVDSVIYPAWIKKGNDKVAIHPGMEILASDNIVTGKNGKVWFKMIEGSTIKIGEKAQIAFTSMQIKTNRSVFSSVVRVLKGAFRFTTNKVRANRWKRNIDFKIGAITAGVRGTDIWGRSNTEKDLVCLLEGKIEVNSPHDDAIYMDKPLDYYIVNKKEDKSTLGVIAQSTINKWAKQTEIPRYEGVVKANGKWSLIMGVFTSEKNANKLVNKLANIGYYAQVIAQGERFRVAVNGFVTKKDITLVKARLEEQLQQKDLWFIYNNKAYSF